MRTSSRSTSSRRSYGSAVAASPATATNVKATATVTPIKPGVTATKTAAKSKAIPVALTPTEQLALVSKNLKASHKAATATLAHLTTLAQNGLGKKNFALYTAQATTLQTHLDAVTAQVKTLTKATKSVKNV